MEVYQRRQNRFDVARYGSAVVARRRARARNNWSRLRSHLGRIGPSNRYSRVIQSRIRWLARRRGEARALAIRALLNQYPRHLVKYMLRFM